MVFNSAQAFRFGQARPVVVDELLTMNKTEKKLLYSSYTKYEDLENIPNLIDVLEYGGTALVLDEFSVPYYYYFGDNNCIYIELVKNEAQLIEKFLKRGNYDFVAVASSNYDEEKYDSLEDAMNKNGYSKYVGSYGAIFMSSKN